MLGIRRDRSRAAARAIWRRVIEPRHGFSAILRPRRLDYVNAGVGPHSAIAAAGRRRDMHDAAMAVIYAAVTPVKAPISAAGAVLGKAALCRQRQRASLRAHRSRLPPRHSRPTFRPSSAEAADMISTARRHHYDAEDAAKP